MTLLARLDVRVPRVPGGLIRRIGDARIHVASGAVHRLVRLVVRV